MKPRFLKDIAHEVWQGYMGPVNDPFLVMASIDDHPAAFGPTFLADEWPRYRELLQLQELGRSATTVEHQNICGPDTTSRVTYIRCATTWHTFEKALRENDIPDILLRKIQIPGQEYLPLDKMKQFLQKGGLLRNIHCPGIVKFLAANPPHPNW